MSARRITIALNEDDSSILAILVKESADDDMTSVFRRALRIAYTQYLANQDDDFLAIVTKEQARHVKKVIDGVGHMSKTAIEQKFKRIR